jgi:hypothetical protein
MTSWMRVEGATRSTDLNGGVEARVADPLWMLARQWQVGEFAGDDAAQPAAIRVVAEWDRVTTLRHAGRTAPIGHDSPLERLVEAAPLGVTGAARLASSARLGRLLRRRLVAKGASLAATALERWFVLSVPDGLVAMPGAGEEAAALVARRSFDAVRLAIAGDEEIDDALAELSEEQRATAREVIDDWRATTVSELSGPPIGSWSAERMEHSFSVAAHHADGTQTVLNAGAYTGGHLDWHSFDIAPNARHTLPDGQDPRTLDEPPWATDLRSPSVVTTYPAPVRYAGMPVARWWEFEDGAVHFGDIDAGPTDLARMIVADFATVFNNDWFVVPVEVPRGTLSRVTKVEVIDNFDAAPVVVAPAAATDDRPMLRAWRMFELTGDTSASAGLSPLLFLPPPASTAQHGPAIEAIDLVRDEGANLAWAIERVVEGAVGRPVDRLQAWRSSRRPPAREVGAKAGLDAAAYAELYWRYGMEAPAPPNWIPLVPQRVAAGSEQVRFRRGRMRAWDLLERDLVGAKGALLEPWRPLTIFEEEVPRSGARVERRWQFARLPDGSTHSWIQRRKQNGRGEQTSGLAWDLLEVVQD